MVTLPYYYFELVVTIRLVVPLDELALMVTHQMTQVDVSSYYRKNNSVMKLVNNIKRH